MSAAAAPVPPQQPGGAPSESVLTPSPWLLEDAPPTAQAVLRCGEAEMDPPPPAILLIDVRAALQEACRQQLAACLSSGERQRHDACRLPADRQRFLLGRAALRRLLGTWLELAPEAVPLETGPHGKPSCPIGPCFNLSHSGDLILLALHPEWPVGVDVERLRPELDWQRLARRLLGESERRSLEGLPACERAEAFLSAWCRLEARLKARGTGLAGLERLRGQERRADEGGADETAAADLSGEGDGRIQGAPPSHERVWEVQVPAGYRAAVALAAAGG